MMMENVTTLTQDKLAGGYRVLTVASSVIAPRVKPGQFVHLRVPQLGESVLRRPFSVFKTEVGTLSILYKNIGLGTQAMTRLRPGDVIHLMGPLGNGFPDPDPAAYPVLVAGGYGLAALYLLAQRAPTQGIVFAGGARSADLLCIQEFEQLGWEIRAATEDGSEGDKGFVTRPLDVWLTHELGIRTPQFFVCGPLGLLHAVAERAMIGNWTAWVSLDRHMGCGVGACLACVQKVRIRPTADAGLTHEPSAPSPGSDAKAWKWARICTEGPVFECRDILWETNEH